MGRIAGDDPGYTFRLCRSTASEEKTGASIFGGPKGPRKITPTEHGFELPSVSTIIGEILAKPPSAMAWWGYRIMRDGIVSALAEGESLTDLDAESLEELMKARNCSPNMSLEEAGDRGTDAHAVLEFLADHWKDDDQASVISEAHAKAEVADADSGAEYAQSAIAFWLENVLPNIEAGYITDVRAEVPVFSLAHRYAGTFDLGLLWAPLDEGDEGGWEICDAKTHKPAQGYTKRGAGYISDAVQNRAYRTAHEEMGLGKTIGQRTIVLRDRAYRKVRWLEDAREVSEDFWLHVRALYDERMAFEKGGG